MQWTIEGGVSASVAVICLVIAGLIWTAGDRHTPRAVVALVICGSVGLAGTPIGETFHDIVAWVDAQAGQLIGKFTGEVIFGVVFLISMYMLCAAVWKKSIDLTTLVFAVTTPTAATVAPGVFGVTSLWIFTGIAGVVAWPIAQMFALT